MDTTRKLLNKFGGGGDGAFIPSQTIQISQLAAQISAALNVDIPAAQVQRAVKRYNRSFLPYNRTTNYTFAAVSALSGLLSINIDASFGFFVTGIAGVQSSSDYNPFVNTIQLNNGTNLLPDPMPFQFLTRYTGKPLDFCTYIPANSQLQTNLTNGSTTAASTFYVTYFGYKLPSAFIEQLTGGQ